VSRSQFADPLTGLWDPSKQGICSNFLCDSHPGDEVQLIGPNCKTLLLPEHDHGSDLIMVATGTGVAPFRFVNHAISLMKLICVVIRAFMRRLFVENTPSARSFTGRAWLLFGVRDSNSLLYESLWRDIQTHQTRERFRIDYALSREQINKKGESLHWIIYIISN
jgi:ferredoxin--NADP+ reductase